MIIDWFTVLAQVLNFVILVWFMKRFLYKPILNALDIREQKIAAELADADAKKAEAQKERDEFQRKNQEFDQQQTDRLTKAIAEVDVERQRLLHEARQSADELKTKRQEALKTEAQNLHQAILQRTQQEVFAIARKTLTDLASSSLEERITELFTRRIREFNGTAKESLGSALKTASNPALVRSTFELSNEQKASIQNALNESFSVNLQINFERSPDLISGIEMSANGQKISWSIANYLTSLENGISELLAKDKQEPKAGSTAAKSVPEKETK